MLPLATPLLQSDFRWFPLRKLKYRKRRPPLTPALLFCAVERLKDAIKKVCFSAILFFDNTFAVWFSRNRGPGSRRSFPALRILSARLDSRNADADSAVKGTGGGHESRSRRISYRDAAIKAGTPAYARKAQCPGSFRQNACFVRHRQNPAEQPERAAAAGTENPGRTREQTGR